MTDSDFDQLLARYADVAVTVGTNVQPGQRLLVIGPRTTGGVALEAAPLVRQIAASAYRAGASLVEVIWGDEAVQHARFAHARRESFGQYSRWLPKAMLEHAQAGQAFLSIYANDPDMFAGRPMDLVADLQQAAAHALHPFAEQIGRNATNWAVIAGASDRWAIKVFPDSAVPDAACTGSASTVSQPASPDPRTRRLWNTIFRMCRIDRGDAVAAWETHLAALGSRATALNAKRYDALRYTGEGTALTVGLPAGHVWISGRSISQNGIPFTANLPTEEVFTMPHAGRIDGTVTASKPLSHGGTMIEGFRLAFSEGRVVKVNATRGEDVLRKLVETDAGAARLGEVALVPHGSPIAQSGLLFYNTLFDENAASHLALGSAYRFTLEGGDGLSDDAFEQAGGNRSAIHVDFMVGSGALDVDGVRADGSAEPLMRSGEWCR